MTLDLKSAYDKEFQYKLSNIVVTIIIIIILGAGLGIGAAIAISTFITTTTTTTSSSLPSSSSSSESSEEIPIPVTDLGSVNGFVISPSGLPVSGASLLVYKHMGLPGSADKSPGYSTSVVTDSDGAYLFSDLPSGLYKFTVTHPDGDVQTIDNYAIWPSSSSSYNFRANSLTG
jgi:carboxypeptidase family protein